MYDGRHSGTTPPPPPHTVDMGAEARLIYRRCHFDAETCAALYKGQYPAPFGWTRQI